MNLNFSSERLEFRPLGPEDLDISTVLLTDPEIMKYVGEVMTPNDVSEDLHIAMRRCAGGCIGIWCLTVRATAEKIGTVILLPMPVEEDDTDWNLVQGDEIPDAQIEVGYLLRRSAWGQGYATEACRRMLQFAFDETPLEEVVATTHDDNLASQRVLIKSGMISEGLRPAYAGCYPFFRLTRRQWLEKSSGRNA
ncbi:MAG: GNAT family N-acetyltransferase [Pseudomonadota bacterium]